MNGLWLMLIPDESDLGHEAASATASHIASGAGRLLTNCRYGLQFGDREFGCWNYVMAAIPLWYSLLAL